MVAQRDGRRRQGRVSLRSLLWGLGKSGFHVLPRSVSTFVLDEKQCKRGEAIEVIEPRRSGRGDRGASR